MRFENSSRNVLRSMGSYHALPSHYLQKRLNASIFYGIWSILHLMKNGNSIWQAAAAAAALSKCLPDEDN